MLFGLALVARPWSIGIVIGGVGLIIAYDAWEWATFSRELELEADAKDRVASQLCELEAFGWSVEHGIPTNEIRAEPIDHLVRAPGFVFTIITRHSTWEEADVGQAALHWSWGLANYKDEAKVVPVICVQQSDREVGEFKSIYVVGGTNLKDFLLEHASIKQRGWGSVQALNTPARHRAKRSRDWAYRIRKLTAVRSD